MKTAAICVLVLACLASMTSARGGGGGGGGGRGGRGGRGERGGYRGYLPTAAERLEHFNETLTRIPESYYVEARALFAALEEILGDDVTSLNDLTDDERTAYDAVKENMKELFDEARFEQSIAFLSEIDQTTARQLQLDIDTLLGDGECRDLSDADKIIFDELHDQLRKLQRESRFEEKVSELSAEDESAARELYAEIEALVGDGTPCDLSDEDKATFDDLNGQLSTLLGDTRTRSLRCDGRGGRGGRCGRGRGGRN